MQISLSYGENGIHCRARPRFVGVEVKLATDHGDEIKICQVVSYYYILTYICGIYTLIYPNILIYASRF
jgi:hypothetical protein